MVLHVDGSGGAQPTWYCDSLAVIEPNLGTRWEFSFAAWFDGKKGDGHGPWTQSRAPDNPGGTTPEESGGNVT